ncbi:hypothetical protein [Actinoallomurus soli]|uniref:hypothetical protein n=1 Tax=Actinoallomurus soli TaxID=2952535 RepID=UPI0020936501|nr:hypothetical protein [Actinoallomurus soli]MCO5970799.1 hypothetical protein [Actinoallomurus soli]
MNKVGLLLDQLHRAETRLGAEFRRVAGREAADQEVYYVCRDLARQCDERAAAIRRLGTRYGRSIAAPSGPGPLRTALTELRRRASCLLGRQRISGLLLLRDLRALFLAAQAANVAWIAVGQLAQALKDGEMLTLVNGLHKENLTQIKWIKSKVREASPQALLT